MSDYSPSYQDVSCYGTLPRDSPRRSKEGSGEIFFSVLSLYNFLGKAWGEVLF